MSMPDLLAKVRIVLARPSHQGNIGAAARAMRTMGLTRLFLVAADGTDSRPIADGVSGFWSP